MAAAAASPPPPPPPPSIAFTASISPTNPNSPSNWKNNDGSNGMIPSVKPPSLNSAVASGPPMGSSPPPHMSTPPGPPLFSSPIHPASHPFRSSPVSPPQPPTFSSPSSFTSPSPPPLLQCSNGSSELQHDDSYMVDGSNIVGESPFVLFSASKVLKQKKKANVASLGFGAFVSPGREISRRGPQIVQREPQRCHNCGAFANIYCSILPGSGQWQCVICRSLNGSDGEYVASTLEELRGFPELSSPTVDYLHTAKKMPGFISISSPIVIVAVDESLDEPHLQHLQTSLHTFVDSLPPTTRLGILLYSRTVSVFDFSENHVASADVIPGATSPSLASLKAIIYGNGVYLAPLHTCVSLVHKIVSSLRPFPFGTAEALRDRCLGVSVEVALALIKGPSMEINRSRTSSRVIVCAGGPNTHGPGSTPHSFDHPNYPYMEKTALKWMEKLGRDAYAHNTVVDVLCAGTCPVRTSIFHPLATASGGVVLLHDDFGEGFGANLQRASSRSSGSHGVMEARCSDEISIVQVVGPGEEASSDSNEIFKNNTAFAIRMLSVEEPQSFSFSMEVKNDIKVDFVYFQFAIDYNGSHEADVSRVVTVRLPTVDSVPAYLQSVQVEVAAVLIAKRILLQAKTPSDSAVMREAIDERVKDIALKFGSKLSKSDLHSFPKELCLLPEYLFHLRRGPLLGSIIGHEDERSVLRNLFLNGSFDLSLRMMAPRCLMHREGGTFEELPAYDLAMQSDTAVVLDHGTHIFIWISTELANDGGRCASALAACRTLAEELGESRFPAPRILDFKEGSSEARYFMPRVIPAHKDPSYEQEARFPQIRSLTTEQRTHLIRKFIHFDDPSFCEWMRSLKLTAPVPI